MAQVAAPIWSTDELEEGAAVAIRNFREVRMHEHLEQYLETFDEYRDAVENLIEGTVDLSTLSEEAVDYLTSPQLLTAVRYLASPAISEDDLKVLAEAVLSPKRLRADDEMAKRVITPSRHGAKDALIAFAEAEILNYPESVADALATTTPTIPYDGFEALEYIHGWYETMTDLIAEWHL